MIKKGFTLIELLIVITIIGILAVAVLSAINPIEQIRRAQDQRLESDSAELLNALERYFTAFFEYPWGDSDPNKSRVSNNLAWIDELILKGEVKSQFRDRDSWDQVYATQTEGTVSLCFAPQSKTFQEQADEDEKGQDGSSGCDPDCYVCLPR